MPLRPPTSPLRILIVEDSAADAELIAATLAADGLNPVCDRVMSREQFEARLDGEYDLIVSDFALPSFDGISAQEIARERRPDLPFVFVSGTMGEEVVIERLKAGATDFVLKGRLGRLPRAVRRALQEAHDRRERDRAREEVRRLNAELEARVAERTRQLAEANEELARRGEELQKAKVEAEAASRAKSEFLSRMSHDLRTPLNAVLGFAQLLETEPGITSDQLESVRQILKGGAHLLELINEVLDISRIEAGHLTLSIEPLNLGELMAEVTGLMRPLATARRISLRVMSDGNDQWHVQADRQRLRQVLVNLVGNAVKYSHANGDVRISTERLDRRIRIRVSDTGPGIPAEKHVRLFQPFERLGAERGAVEGTGLGLALAKGLIEAMNGSIGIETADVGATFWIELPEASHDLAPATVTANQTDGDHELGTVLYIEDNYLNVRLLERLLSRRPGVRLITAHTGEEGIEVAIRERPGLILLDLHLPDGSGEELLQRLRVNPSTVDIPVVVLSADATPSLRERLVRLGAQAYFTKPLVLASLLDLVDTHLDRRRRESM